MKSASIFFELLEKIMIEYSNLSLILKFFEIDLPLNQFFFL